MTRMKIIAIAAMLAGSSTFAMAQQAGGGRSQGPANVDMYEAFKGPNPSPSDARNLVSGYYGRLGPARGYTVDSGMNMMESGADGIVDERYEVMDDRAVLEQDRRLGRGDRMSNGRRAPITRR